MAPALWSNDKDGSLRGRVEECLQKSRTYIDIVKKKECFCIAYLHAIMGDIQNIYLTVTIQIHAYLPVSVAGGGLCLGGPLLCCGSGPDSGESCYKMCTVAAHPAARNNLEWKNPARSLEMVLSVVGEAPAFNGA